MRDWTLTNRWFSTPLAVVHTLSNPLAHQYKAISASVGCSGSKRCPIKLYNAIGNIIQPSTVNCCGYQKIHISMEGSVSLEKTGVCCKAYGCKQGHLLSILLHPHTSLSHHLPGSIPRNTRSLQSSQWQCQSAPHLRFSVASEDHSQQLDKEQKVTQLFTCTE